LAQRERPLRLRDFPSRRGDLLKAPRFHAFQMDGGLFAFGYEVEKPRGLFERRQVHSGSLDPCFIDGDRRCDLIPFAAQGGKGMHE